MTRFTVPLIGVSILAATLVAAQDINRATFNADGSVNIPENWREWVFVGARR